MNYIRKLVIRQTPFPKERKAAILRAHQLEEEYNNVKIIADFVVSPNFLDDAELESDNDLSEVWVYNKLKNLQYHIVQIDMTKQEWKKLGIRKGLYGQSNIVTTKFGRQAITYGRWDRQIGAKHAEMLPDEFQPIHPLTVGTWHEDCHAISDIMNVIDLTHYHFYGMRSGERWQRDPTPHLAWASIPMWRLHSLNHRDLMQLTNLWTMLYNIYYQFAQSKEDTLLHPVEDYKSYVTQGYGVQNDIYRLTKHHIGEDYATPEGTPVRAPWGGQVVVSGYSKSLGYFCHFQYEYKGKTYTDRYLHLQSIPAKGEYKRGTIIGKTGKTGFALGAHIHIDIWVGDVDLTIINQNNFREITRHPQTHYGN